MRTLRLAAVCILGSAWAALADVRPVAEVTFSSSAPKEKTALRSRDHDPDAVHGHFAAKIAEQANAKFGFLDWTTNAPGSTTPVFRLAVVLRPEPVDAPVPDYFLRYYERIIEKAPDGRMLEKFVPLDWLGQPTPLYPDRQGKGAKFYDLPGFENDVLTRSWDDLTSSRVDIQNRLLRSVVLCKSVRFDVDDDQQAVVLHLNYDHLHADPASVVHVAFKAKKSQAGPVVEGKMQLTSLDPCETCAGKDVVGELGHFQFPGMGMLKEGQWHARIAEVLERLIHSASLTMFFYEPTKGRDVDPRGVTRRP